MSRSLIERVGDRARQLFGVAQDAVKSGATSNSVLTKYGLSILVGLMRLAEEEGDSGEQKKEFVMTMVAEFYDTVIAPIDMPGPDVIVDAVLRRVVLSVADWAVESYISYLKSRNLTP